MKGMQVLGIRLLIWMAMACVRWQRPQLSDRPAVACSLFQALFDLCAQLCPALMSTSTSAHSGRECPMFTSVGHSLIIINY